MNKTYEIVNPSDRVLVCSDDELVACVAEMRGGGTRTVEVGDDVEYVCHESWGSVRVRFADGAEGAMHPHCFARLR